MLIRAMKTGTGPGLEKNGTRSVAGGRLEKRARPAVARFDKKLRELKDQIRHPGTNGSKPNRKFSKLFRVEPGAKVIPKKVDPEFTAGHKKKSALQELEKLKEKLAELQFRLFADGKQSLLICLQGLDASGKDGTIVHVFNAIDPLGLRTHNFKVPTREEAAHDFLWRITRQTPARGEVVIFNRSHYEDVLVARVRGIVPKKVWKQRYAMINEFERKVAANGTRILKFFLHISPEEQLRRFRKRLDDPTRHWKISESDYVEREFLDDYLDAYKEALTRTSTKHAPWFVIPSNNKWFRNLAVAKIVVETLKAMKIKYPKTTVSVGEIKHKYHSLGAVTAGQAAK